MHRRVAVTVALLVAGFALVAVAGGTAVAEDHYEEIEYEEDANYTVEFPGDRTPGEQVSVIERARSPVDVEYIDTARIFTPMNADSCTDGDIRTFGIDRGSNNSGTNIDDPLLDNYKDDYEGESRPEGPPMDLSFEIWADFWDEEDFQDGTHIRTEDTIILYREGCYVTPEEPGWYRAVGMMNGTGYDGEYQEGWAKSDYFWIGDYEDEEEARTELGPPPNESPQDTPTPDGDATETATPDSRETATPTAESGDVDTPTPESGDEDTPTPEPQDVDTATPTEADDGAGSDGDGAGSDGGGDTGDGDVDTPASGDGPGFGAIAALAAVLATTVALRRR